MSQKSGHPLFYKILEELADMHDKKNKQYASETEPLSNFDRTARTVSKLLNDKINNKKLAYAMTLMAKQIDAVYDMVGEGKKDTVEEIEDKFKDIAVYSIICMILSRDNNG